MHVEEAFVGPEPTSPRAGSDEQDACTEGYFGCLPGKISARKDEQCAEIWTDASKRMSGNSAGDHFFPEDDDSDWLGKVFGQP